MSDLTAGIGTAERVGDLAIRAPFVAPAAPCKAAVQHFWDDPALPALSVLDEAGAPVGIAGRDRLLGIFANEVHHALYERRPVARLMSRRPLVVEADTTIEAVAEQIAAAYPGAMQDGFIIVEQGRYLGIGTALDLMRSSAAQARACHRSGGGAPPVGAGQPQQVADERKLMQVVLNLAGNAVKYTQAGGAVVVRLRAARDSAAIEVEDTGIGIAEADLERILQPFVRASIAYIRSVEGTGIGLPLTKALVELHQGELRMASRLGIGMLAPVKLPPARLVPAAEALGSAA